MLVNKPLERTGTPVAQRRVRRIAGRSPRRNAFMPGRSSGLLYALSGTSLTMFQKPPSDARQLPRDTIVAMFELALRCQSSSLIDNEPIA